MPNGVRFADRVLTQLDWGLELPQASFPFGKTRMGYCCPLWLTVAPDPDDDDDPLDDDWAKAAPGTAHTTATRAGKRSFARDIGGPFSIARAIGLIAGSQASSHDGAGRSRPTWHAAGGGPAPAVTN
jgi:hypothetical protein